LRYLLQKTLVLLYRCEALSLILREELVLRVLRRIFGPKTDYMTRGWRELHMWSSISFALHQILSDDQIKDHRIHRKCSVHGENEQCIENFGWKA
jgi:hypothetical protein